MPSLPDESTSPAEILSQIDAMRVEDAVWRNGRTFSLIYNTGDAELEQLQEDVARRFLHENALNPFAFPSLRTLEADLVAMGADLLQTSPRAGSLTSGGTESILMAMKVARDVAEDRGVERPEILAPVTAHPAFAKAAQTLGIDLVQVPLRDDYRADVDAMAGLVTERTAVLVASAPCYPYGVIDPVTEVAALAADRGLLCHVDACLGGWLLPFWRDIGRPVVPFDFSVPGVTSMSADIHKYGYTFKGASLVLYRDTDLIKRQYFFYDRWPGGLYGAPAAPGTRPAAPIAAAWATVKHLGRDGYRLKASQIAEATDGFREGIEAIAGLEVTGEPDMSLFEFSATQGDISAIGDKMDDAGWHLDRQQGGLHLMVSPYHLNIVDEFLSDLAAAVQSQGQSRGVVGSYGGGAPEDVS